MCCWEVWLWVEYLERMAVKGGWAVQCPTQGGTDEVKQKWRERGRGEWRRRSDKEQEQESKKKPQNRTELQEEH